VVQLTYDTTFNLGDFYLSVLLFRETDFEGEPVIPLAYFLHERKLNATHTNFFRHMKSLLPELETTSNVYIVTDSEAAIVSALKLEFPNLKSFLCWNHTIQVHSLQLLYLNLFLYSGFNIMDSL